MGTTLKKLAVPADLFERMLVEELTDAIASAFGVSTEQAEALVPEIAELRTFVGSLLRTSSESVNQNRQLRRLVWLLIENAGGEITISEKSVEAYEESAACVVMQKMAAGGWRYTNGREPKTEGLGE